MLVRVVRARTRDRLVRALAGAVIRRNIDRDTRARRGWRNTNRARRNRHEGVDGRRNDLDLSALLLENRRCPGHDRLRRRRHYQLRRLAARPVKLALVPLDEDNVSLSVELRVSPDRNGLFVNAQRITESAQLVLGGASIADVADGRQTTALPILRIRDLEFVA